MNKKRLDDNGNAMVHKGSENLRSWKPGQSGNPEGGRAHNPALRALRNFTNETFREVLEKVLAGSPGDLRAMITSKDSTNLEILVARAFADATKNGSFALVERIAERLLGKVPDTVNVNNRTDIRAAVASMDRAELKKLLAELEEDV